MVECQLPKLNTRVRFPYPAPNRMPVPFGTGILFGTVRHLTCSGQVNCPCACDAAPAADWLSFNKRPERDATAILYRRFDIYC